MASVKELLELVRVATGPDRELDHDIHAATNPPLRPGLRFGNVPTYSASIDAALALTERLLPGWCSSNGRDANDQCWAYVWSKKRAISPHEGSAEGMPSRPLAILAALLSALSTKEG